MKIYALRETHSGFFLSFDQQKMIENGPYELQLVFDDEELPEECRIPGHEIWVTTDHLTAMRITALDKIHWHYPTVVRWSPDSTAEFVAARYEIVEFVQR